MSLLQCQQLAVNIAAHKVCQSLDFELAPGQRWAMLGRNGVGKTTLLQTLAGLRRADAGSLSFVTDNINTLSRLEIARQLGILFQHQDDPFPSTVLETCLIGRHPHIDRWGWESAEDEAMARQALEQLGLAAMSDRQVDSLSGGERQRLAIAILLCQQPRLLLLDEPTNHLDIHQQIVVLDLLKAWTETEGRGLIMTLHDLNLARRYCSHGLLLLGDGEVIAGEITEIMTAANLERLYLHPIEMFEGPWGQAYLPR